MNSTISTNKAPSAIGPYSQAVLANNTLYVSGQLPINFENPSFLLEGIVAQTNQSLQNIMSIVQSAGFSKLDIVKCTVYMKNLSDFSLMNQEYEKFFGSVKPARVTIEVSRLPKNSLIEIDAIAVK
ncbi:MAG: Rid family detoxifying hydrolase [Candidatus Izemoplasmatales bacterium]|jgi:2-iminobutanoate/2-iminopropanoate deaminase|nr:Rid family detoxifying hydrolase [Candidatus Izemoplasmatales bacterium]